MKDNNMDKSKAGETFTRRDEYMYDEEFDKENSDYSNLKPKRYDITEECKELPKAQLAKIHAAFLSLPLMNLHIDESKTGGLKISSNFRKRLDTLEDDEEMIGEDCKSVSSKDGHNAEINSSDSIEGYEFEDKPPPKLKFNKELESIFDEQNDYCHKWIDGGNIMLCDSCPKVFHKSWVGFKSLNHKSWQCPYWKGDWANLWAICEEEWSTKQPVINDSPPKRKRGRPRKIPKETTENSKNSEGTAVKNQNNMALSEKYMNMGIQCPLCKCLTHLKWLDVPLIAILDSPKYFNLSYEEKKRLLEECKHDKKLQYICQWCLESKEIEKFFAYMEKPSDKITELDSEQFTYDDQWFEDRHKKDYLYLVKFK